MKSLNVRIQVKTIEQYFPAALFIMLDKVVLTLSLWVNFVSVAIHVESYWAVLFEAV